mgnify:CR=1 FL=1|jgi:serine/threonine protein kinase
MSSSQHSSITHGQKSSSYSTKHTSISTTITTSPISLNVPDYELIQTLGSGSFGFVFSALDHKSNPPKKVALKRIEKVGNTLSREYEILFDIKSCPHAVKLLDFYYSKNNQNKLIQNIVFEYMDDNLENMIQAKYKNKDRFREKEIKLMIYQVLRGLDFIHGKNIVHRDLKPENLLWKRGGVVKICDFGSSKYIDPNGQNTPYIVSRYYRAPELIW